MTMNAIVSEQPAPAENETQRLVVRMNATLFHAVGMALLFEDYALACARCTGVDELRGREREEHVRWLRSYVGRLWPEFAWNAASHDFDAGGATAEQAATAIRCAAVICSAVSRWADDPELRGRLHAMAEAEHRHASFPQSAHQQRRLPGERGPSLLLLRRHARMLREPMVARAYRALQEHWTDVPPFDTSTYHDFLKRFASLAALQARLDWKQRLLLRMWVSGCRAVGSHGLFAASGGSAACAHNGPAMARALPCSSAVR